MRLTTQAAKARERAQEKAKKNAPKGAASQLKVNAAAANIICQICRSTFLCTSTGEAGEQAVADQTHRPGFVMAAKQ